MSIPIKDDFKMRSHWVLAYWCMLNNINVPKTKEALINRLSEYAKFSNLKTPKFKYIDVLDYARSQNPRIKFVSTLPQDCLREAKRTSTEANLDEQRPAKRIILDDGGSDSEHASDGDFSESLGDSTETTTDETKLQNALSIFPNCSPPEAVMSSSSSQSPVYNSAPAPKIDYPKIYYFSQTMCISASFEEIVAMVLDEWRQATVGNGDIQCVRRIRDFIPPHFDRDNVGQEMVRNFLKSSIQGPEAAENVKTYILGLCRGGYLKTDMSRMAANNTCPLTHNQYDCPVWFNLDGYTYSRDAIKSAINSTLMLGNVLDLGHTIIFPEQISAVMLYQNLSMPGWHSAPEKFGETWPIARGFEYGNAALHDIPFISIYFDQLGKIPGGHKWNKMLTEIFRDHYLPNRPLQSKSCSGETPPLFRDLFLPSIVFNARKGDLPVHFSNVEFRNCLVICLDLTGNLLMRGCNFVSCTFVMNGPLLIPKYIGCWEKCSFIGCTFLVSTPSEHLYANIVDSISCLLGSEGQQRVSSYAYIPGDVFDDCNGLTKPELMQRVNIALGIVRPGPGDSLRYRVMNDSGHWVEP